MLPLLLLSFLLISSHHEQIAVVRPDPNGGRRKPLHLLAHGTTGFSLDCLGAVTASDLSFHNLKGPHPVKACFAVDWDGDGLDEIAVVRVRKRRRHRLDLSIYLPPDELGGQVGRAVASSKGNSLGRARGDGKVVALGPLDLDGDGKDELAVVRQWRDGSQSIDIRSLPPSRKTPVGPPLVSDRTFGSTGTDEIISLFGSDRDGDGRDEIISLRRSTLGPDRLLVQRTPGSLDGETGPPLASDNDVTPYQGTNLAISRTDVDGDGVDEILFLHEWDLPYATRWIDIFPIPASLGADLGDPVLADMALNGIQSDRTTFGAFGLRTPAYNPILSGNYEVWFLATFDGFESAPPTWSEWIGPWTGLSGVQAGAGFTMHYPDGTAISGPVELDGLVQSVEFPPNEVSLTALTDSPGGNVRAGDTITYRHSPSWFEEHGSEMTSECYCGTVSRFVPGVGDVLVAYVAQIRFVRVP